jgi:hypothetical protein
VSGLPPTYISVGGLDLFLEENLIYADRLFVILDALGDSGYRDRGDPPVRNCVVRSGRGYALGIGEVRC